MFFIIFVLGACTVEELVSSAPEVEDNAPVAIAISLDDITSVNMNSRAAEDDSRLSAINDVNIKVNFGTNILTVYLVKSGNSFKISDGVENGSASLVDSKTVNGTVYVHITAQQGNKASGVEVIGNYGGKINAADWETAKNKLLQWPADFSDKSACLLYGCSNNFTFNDIPHEGAQGGKGCYLSEVPLKRPYAMVKVNINTSGLGDEVILTPTSVQLCNVPKTCTLASENSMTDFASFDKEGQKYDFPSGLLLTAANGGGEIQATADRLYLFENKQTVHAQNCKDAKSSNEKAKTPNRIKVQAATAKEVYAAFTDYEDGNNLGRRCSYILFTANYEYQSENAHVKGTIRYRLFLGKDISYDFDVNRNTIYNVTLNLRGSGGIKESGSMTEDGVINVSGNSKDAQWRVDSELSDLFIHFDEGQDYNIDGHLVKIKVVSSSKQKWQIKADDFEGNHEDWVKFETDYGWITPKYDQYNRKEGMGETELKMFLKGYAESEDYFKKDWNAETPYRSCTIYVRKLDGSGNPIAGSEMSYPIKQWFPIKIRKGQPAIYVDRIDRFANNGLPWGSDEYKTSLTDSKKITIDYANKYYSNDDYEKNVMSNSVNVALNSSGDADPVNNFVKGFYHYTLPTKEEWETIDKVLSEGINIDNPSEPIKYNHYQRVPYWTISSDGTESYVYNPGTGAQLVKRNSRYRFRLIWGAGLYY